MSKDENEPNPRRLICLFMANASSGGAERVMINIANGLVQRDGIDVTLVLVEAAGEYLDQIHPAIEIVDLDCSRALTSVVPLARFLRRARPDAALSALNPTNIALIMAARVASPSTRIIVSDHANLGVAVERSTNRRAKLFPKILRTLYPLADEILGVSRGVCDNLAETTGLDRSKISVQFNPVVTNEVRTKAEMSSHDPWFEEAEELIPVFLNIGRLADQKNQELLLRSFASVRSGQKCRLLVLGEGPLLADLRQLANDLGVAADVRFPGFVTNPYAYLSAAHAFVLSSRFEGLPTVIIEALFCGCPVISTDCPDGPREILKDGQFGTLVPTDDQARLAEAMADSLRETPGIIPQESWEPFTSEIVIEQYFERLMGPPQR